jgi:phenylpropionate dioxygenase-like ring-hydroxylating dioxygenase large terminal subunit
MERANTYARMVDAENGVIDREIFTGDQVYADELERVFTRAWLFIGHESQVPNPGDFFTSRMGDESVILCRDRAHKIHVLLNSCRHRGMKVCLYDEGNTNTFTCPYHAWSYGLDGALTGVPMQKTLYEDIDKEKWSLVEVAQITNYKGTIWATWDPEAPPLMAYLGDVKEHLDLALDCRDGREGGSVVFGGVQKWIVPTNWKLPAENFAGDTYHNPSHRSVDMIGLGATAQKGVQGRHDNRLADAQHIWVSFPGGHAVHSAVKAESNEYYPSFAEHQVVEDYFRSCHEGRKARMGDKARLQAFVGTIFPNTSFHGYLPRTICVLHPHGPQTTEIWRFYFTDHDTPSEVNTYLRHHYMRYSGPAGMTEQDDMENWNYATSASRGTIAKRYPFNYQQSMNKISQDSPYAGCVSEQITEENARAFYRGWRRYMTGEDWDGIYAPSSRHAISGDD